MLLYEKSSETEFQSWCKVITCAKHQLLVLVMSMLWKKVKSTLGAADINRAMKRAMTIDIVQKLLECCITELNMFLNSLLKMAQSESNDVHLALLTKLPLSTGEPREC